MTFTEKLQRDIDAKNAPKSDPSPARVVEAPALCTIEVSLLSATGACAHAESDHVRSDYERLLAVPPPLRATVELVGPVTCRSCQSRGFNNAEHEFSA